MKPFHTLGPLTLAALLASATSVHPNSADSSFQLTPQDALETHGLSIFLFHNSYHPVFGDQKSSGLEIVFHEQRIATNGDVRLSPTPAQWDPTPQFKERKHGAAANELVATLAYPDRDLAYRIDVRPEDGGLRVAVLLDRPLPPTLAGKAGFNLEFLPTAYYGKS
ncbi:MAG TPA: glycoside hydrolase, partial [Candidatus Sulfotelmatobacter sp.]|nr:glycoside hydrolase [Candidatus Sulfotelmatobacter sp.]